MLLSLAMLEASLKHLDEGRTQTRPTRRLWLKPGRASARWDDFATQVGYDRFQMMYSYSCGRAKKIRKRYRADRNIFENGE